MGDEITLDDLMVAAGVLERNRTKEPLVFIAIDEDDAVLMARHLGGEWEVGGDSTQKISGVDVTIYDKIYQPEEKKEWF